MTVSFRRTLTRGIALILFIGLAVLSWWGYRLVWGQPLNINHFADRSAIELTAGFPEGLSFLGFIDNTPLDFHSDKLSDPSPAGLGRGLATRRAQYEQLLHYDRSALRGQQALTYDYLAHQWGANLRAADWPWHFDNSMYVGPYPVNQLDGLQIMPLTTLTQFHQVVDTDSAGNYLARMAAIPTFLQQVEATLVASAEAGAIAPTLILDRVIDQLDTLITTPAPQWAVHSTLQAHLEGLEINEADREPLLTRSEQLLQQQIIPAYKTLRNVIAGLRERAPEHPGLWTLPDGENYYAALLQIYTTTERSPDEVHQLGLSRVADLKQQMETTLDNLGYTHGTIGERVGELAASESALYAPSPDLRDRILADYSDMEDNLAAATADAFLTLTPQPLAVRPAPPEKAGGAAAYYLPPAMNGSRPGVFYANLLEPEATQRFAMLTLAAHEGIPGHHFQVAGAMLLEGLPMYRRVMPMAAFQEGWALYAERLVYDLGLHDDFSNVGRLQAEMFRAVRLVVDTGLHSKQWSRQRAIDYMLQHTGMPTHEVVAEIDRYIAMPGQACAYMSGMLEILELREEARIRQGDRFSLAAFHEAVLSNGPLPLPVLRQAVTAQLP